MSDRYRFEETSQPQSWPDTYKPEEEPVRDPAAERVYDAARDVLVYYLPLHLAVAAAEEIRSKVRE